MSLPCLCRRTVMWLRRNVYDTLDEGKLYSVIDQAMTPLSGSKHDYQSMGFYWWPCTQALKVRTIANIALTKQFTSEVVSMFDNNLTYK